MGSWTFVSFENLAVGVAVSGFRLEDLKFSLLCLHIRRLILHIGLLENLLLAAVIVWRIGEVEIDDKVQVDGRWVDF